MTECRSGLSDAAYAKKMDQPPTLGSNILYMSRRENTSLSNSYHPSIFKESWIVMLWAGRISSNSQSRAESEEATD